jgi:hypothetical protein
MNRKPRGIRALWLGIVLVVTWSGAAQAQWTALANSPKAGTGGAGPNTATVETCELLTDGTVMCHEYATNHWHRLTPDINGSYINGTWDSSTITDMPNGNDSSFGCNNCTYAPTYFGTEVLKDGKVVVIGGEYVSLSQVWTNIGFIYDPVANMWSTQLTENNFGGGNVGDGQTVLLQDGTFLLPNITNTQMESLNEATTSFTLLTTSGKADRFDEEGWTILPNNTILTVDSTNASSFEIFNPSGNTSVTSPAPGTWGLPPGITSSATPVNLADTSNLGGSAELGPAVLRPDGTVVYFSGNSLGQNAVYDWAAGTWTHPTGIDFPVVPNQTYNYSVKDGPASLLPNGNVLVQAAPVSNTGGFLTGSHFYEVALGTNALSAVADPPNAANLPSFEGRMLLLPSGEVLWTSEAGDIQIYSNGGAPQNAWRPAITSLNPHVAPGTTYLISGTLFNGFSQGAFYGDNSQSSTNYPLVRITVTASGHVFYARTHDHSRMGVEAVGDTEIISTNFDGPAGLETGPCTVAVVANGIASTPVSVNCSPEQSPVALCRDISVNADATCHANVTPAQVNNGTSDPDGDNLSLNVSPSSGLTRGNNTVTLTATDPSGASSSCSANVQVVDATPPTFSSSNPTSFPIVGCDPTHQNLTAPAVTDICNCLSVTGQVTAVNGVGTSIALAQIGPTTFQGNLPVGVLTVQWTATNCDNVSSQFTQTITLTAAPALYATNELGVHNNSTIATSAGTGAPIDNLGTGSASETEIFTAASTGSVLSVSFVQLNGDTVHGSVQTAGTVQDNGATVTGQISQHSAPTLPPFPSLSVPSPFPSGSNVNVNSGQTSTLAPGAYGAVEVFAGGTLKLLSGTYFFREVNVQARGTVKLDTSGGPITLDVKESIAYHGSISSNGQANQFVLGYIGTSTVDLPTAFSGVVIAPSAPVQLTGPSGTKYAGAFYGQNVIVNGSITVTESPFACQ